MQDFIEAAFAKLVGKRVVVVGSGRTDAGVHALGQVAHADVVEAPVPFGKWQAALNSVLPPEIRILRVTRVAAIFHAQFSARGKRYTYRIYNAPFLHPLEIGRAWFVPGAIDLPLLRDAAALLIGCHDFVGFAANRGKPEEVTVRTLHRIAIQRRGPLLTLTFEGDGFLYKMVRLLTGTLIRIAQGKAPPMFITELLAAKGALKTHFQAPAGGLYLSRVRY